MNGRIDREPGVALAIEKAGGIRPLASILGIQHQAIHTWRRVPAERAIQIERALGIPKSQLRPDLWEPTEAD